MTRAMTNQRTSRTVAGMACAAALVLGLGACGDEVPGSGSVPTQPTDDGAGDSAAPEPTSADSTEEPPAETTTETAAPTPPPAETATETETAPETAPETETGDGGEDEEAGQGQALVQEYADLLAAGDAEGAFEMLSEESEAYYYEPAELTDSPGMADMIGDISTSGDVRWTSRPAYPETHNSAEAVTAWGTDSEGTPFAYGWAARTTNDGEWVVDQDRFEVSAGQSRVAWLNPGSSMDDPTLIEPGLAPLFGLTKVEGIENVAVNATIDEGEMFVGEALTELPTEGVVQYELTEFDYGTLDPTAPHALTVAFVAEDEPFVHVQAAGFTLPADRR